MMIKIKIDTKGLKKFLGETKDRMVEAAQIGYTVSTQVAKETVSRAKEKVKEAKNDH